MLPLLAIGAIAAAGAGIGSLVAENNDQEWWKGALIGGATGGLGALAVPAAASMIGGNALAVGGVGGVTGGSSGLLGGGGLGSLLGGTGGLGITSMIGQVGASALGGLRGLGGLMGMSGPVAGAMNAPAAMSPSLAANVAANAPTVQAALSAGMPMGSAAAPTAGQLFGGAASPAGGISSFMNPEIWGKILGATGGEDEASTPTEGGGEAKGTTRQQLFDLVDDVLGSISESQREEARNQAIGARTLPGFYQFPAGVTPYGGPLSGLTSLPIGQRMLGGQLNF